VRLPWRATVLDFRKKAPLLKPYLPKVGCDLPFYDFLDSYEEEFAKTVTAAMKNLPTLLGVHEVELSEFESTDWSLFGCDPKQQIVFSVDDQFASYGKGNPKANVRGSAAYFLDGTSDFRSVVLIPRNPKCTVEYKDLKYAIKIATLMHELGHIHDAEHRTNIDPIASRFDIIEAEAYANCAALDGLAERCMSNTYDSFYEAMEGLAASGGYEAEVGRLVLERHSRCQIPKWQDYMDAATQLAGARQ
jgi:hypothetical protein